MNAHINLRYFASIREALNLSEETLPLSDALTTVGDVRDALLVRGEPYSVVLSRQKAVRIALNHSMCDESTSLTDGCEVAFFPPVTGG